MAKDDKTEQDFRERRAYLLQNAKSKTVINRKDKRVSGSRVCDMCKQPLSKVLFSTGKGMALDHHYHLKFNEFISVYLCFYAYQCLERYRELVEEKGDDHNG